MPKYNTYTDQLGNFQIERVDDDGMISYIPSDPANSDYQAYLASLEDK
jgi:hypothetical protein